MNRVMDILRIRANRLIVGAMVVVAILGGGIYASASVTASATDTVVLTEGHTNLSTTGGVYTTVLSLTLQGSSTSAVGYVLSSYGDLVNGGPSDVARCAIVVNGATVAAANTVVGDPTQHGSIYQAGIASTFALAGGFTLPAGTASGSAILECEHDDTNGAAPYIDGLASLVAHRTGSLKVATEP